MRLPQLNAVQKSLLIPSGAAFVLGGLFGVGGFALGGLAALAASPVIYWKAATKEKAKWKRVLTASLLSGSGMLLSCISGLIGVETVLKAVRPDAYRQYTMETSTGSQQRLAAAPPVEQVKPTFTATLYPPYTKPEVTQGTAILDKNAKTVEWYNNLDEDPKFKRYHRCSADGSYWGKDIYMGYWSDGSWSGNAFRCNVSAVADNTPRQFNVVYADGDIWQTVQVTMSAASKSKAAVRPIINLPDKATVMARCKELANAKTATGEIDWDEIDWDERGTGSWKWYASAARLVLGGTTKSKYGKTVRFAVDCKGQPDGTVTGSMNSYDF